MTRSATVYLRVLTPAAGVVAAMFFIEHFGFRYAASVANANRDLSVPERLFLGTALWIGRYGWLTVPFIVGGALFVALWLAHAAPTPGQHAMHRLSLAVACLRVSAVLYLAVGVALVLPGTFAPALLPQAGARTRYVLAVICLALAVMQEVAVRGIRRRRLWAWALGLATLSLHVPTCFFPLGALGLWGLLARGSQQELGILETRSSS